MKDLVQEATLITKELGDVTFVGALAVYMYTKIRRGTGDLDFAIAHSINHEELLSKEYKILQRNGKEIIYTPRNKKIDIYTNDIAGIPVTEVIKSAEVFRIGKNDTSPSIKVASLEVLIYTKYKAARPQDFGDLKEIATIKFINIDWGSLRSIVDSQLEFDDIQKFMSFHKN